MIFFSDKADKNGARVAARLGKELGGAATAYRTEVQGEEVRPRTLGSALRESIGELGEGPTIRPMYTFHFELSAPRPFTLGVTVINVGGITVVGALRYAARLRGRLGGAVFLEEEKALHRSRFTGDTAGAERLNAAPGLVKRTNRFLRGELALREGEKVTLERELVLAPDGDGVRIAAATLPRKTWFGLGARLDAADFVAIAGLAEATLAR